MSTTLAPTPDVGGVGAVASDETPVMRARYLRHIALAEEATTSRARAWHIAAARGLYRLMVDIEMDGGPACPMGMPHALCLTDAEVRSLAV